MNWIDIKDKLPSNKMIHFLTDGKSVYVVGNKLNPFYILLYGEYKKVCDFIPTHWCVLPDLPKNDKLCEICKKFDKTINENGMSCNDIFVVCDHNMNNLGKY